MIYLSKEELENTVEELEEMITLLKEVNTVDDLEELEGIERLQEVYSLDDIDYELRALEDDLRDALTTLEDTDWEFDGNWWDYNGISQSDFI